MHSSQLPSVELIQGTQPPPPQPQRGPASWRRWKVFFSVLLVVGLIGLAFVYARSPIYRATVSVLTVKPKAIDKRSEAADVEHVQIQRRLLLGDELLGRLGDDLVGENIYLDANQLRAMLDAAPVPQTNLLELAATGEEPTLLQQVINAWAESYETFRADEIAAATGEITAELSEEQMRVKDRLEIARLELQAFRAKHDIVSLERSENRSLSKLKGLNNSLNKAQEQLIEAQAREAAIIDAIARGETVVPSEQKESITAMRLAVQRAEVQLGELKQKYTQRYIDRDPELKRLPRELAARKAELRRAIELGRQTARDEATQETAAASLSIAALEKDLEEHQRDVQEFTLRFKEFKTLEDGLARLEELHGEIGTRLHQIEVKNFKKYPPIKVVEWARLPSVPIHPDYERDAMIVLGSALVLALFATWLVEYLSEKPRRQQAQPQIGIKIIGGEAAPALSAQPPQERLLNAVDPATPQIGSAPPNAAQLPVLPRELTAVEIQSLLGNCEPQVGAYLGLLLTGVSPFELPLLHNSCFEPRSRQITVPGAAGRSYPISERAWGAIEGVLPAMRGQESPLSVGDLDASLSRAAAQAGLSDTASIDALSIWHSYVLYLIRQGIDMDDLAHRVGALPPDIGRALSFYAPPGASRPLASIDFTYPTLGT